MDASGTPPEIRARVHMLEGDVLATGRRLKLLLCHGVFSYFADRRPAGCPGGAGSVLVRDGDALAMRTGLLGGWPVALRAFDDFAYDNASASPRPLTWVAVLVVHVCAL